MKLLAIALTVSLASACANKKNAETTETTEQQETVQENTTLETVDAELPVMEEKNTVIGTVHVSEDCPVWFEVTETGQKFYPVNLPDRYKAEGTGLQLDYTMSRAPQPAGCDVEMTVSVSNISPLM